MITSVCIPEEQGTVLVVILPSPVHATVVAITSEQPVTVVSFDADIVEQYRVVYVNVEDSMHEFCCP